MLQTVVFLWMHLYPFYIFITSLFD